MAKFSSRLNSLFQTFGLGSQFDRECGGYASRKYHFASEVDKWIFEQDPERYKRHENLIDRFLGGQIEPANLEGVLAYMGIGVVSPGGDDAHNYAWVDKYRTQMAAAS